MKRPDIDKKYRNNNLIAFLIIAIIYILDRLAKLYAVNNLQQSKVIVKNLIELKLSFNTGAAFSILKDSNNLLTAISIIIILIIMITISIAKLRKSNLFAFYLILAGALGNLTDRILYKQVIDFISISIWPSFNIADAAISIGVMILIISTLRGDKTWQTKKQKQQKMR